MTGPDVIQFVDSIAASPTVRLDLNDDTRWWCREFQALPPRLRYSVSNNAMSDGAYVSSSAYDGRTLTLTLDLVASSQDINAEELQKLARELDRDTNLIRYQPNGATKPVFFKTSRADFADLFDQQAALAVRRLTIDIPAEPFALGLRESISVGTVSNDPAAANGCYVDVTGVIGDVAAEPVITFGTDTAAGETLILATLPEPSASLPVAVQAESMTLGTDTTNPGGAADAAMSGSGTTNYRRTSFATSASLSTRLSWSSSTLAERDALTGTWRVLAAVRLSNNTTTVQIQPAWAGDSLAAYHYGGLVTPVKTANRQLIDLGLVTFGTISDLPGGVNLSLSAQRDSGTGTLDWDFILFVPAVDSQARMSGDTFNTVDVPAANAYATKPTAADRWTASGYTAGTAQVTGGFPRLRPNVTTRLYWTTYAADPVLFGAYDKTKTATVTVNYQPRYQFVRPVAS